MEELKFSHYGECRELNCTDGEREIFEIIRSLIDDEGLDSSIVKLVRKSDSYVSVVMATSREDDVLDIARIKYTPRARWIKTGTRFVKYPIGKPNDVTEYAQEIYKVYRFNEPYL